MNRVAIVILNWNGENLLREYLPSVVAYSKDATIVIADNGSSDSSLNYIKTNFPQIKTIDLKTNYGFAKGYNKALEILREEKDFSENIEYYILLNSDVKVTENWIQPIITLMDSDEKIAAVQPKILSISNPTMFEYAGAAGGFIDYLGYPFCRGRIFDIVEKDNGQYDDEKQIFWASGAAFFVRKKVFEELNGFDEMFFAHQEEIDLCWRMQNKGYKIFYSFHSVCYHLGGGTLNKTSPKKTYLNFRNNLFMLYKNLPKKKQYIIPIRIILNILSSFLFLFKGKKGEFLAVNRANYHFLKNKKYLKINKNQKINSLPKTIYPKSIVGNRLLIFLRNLG
ncbi:MAG: glycosyltransferase family 2 protein [Bacteroidales bacterium]|jgi:GT2 family glycosyltransferase|nr:glycosyltransferase family 2 protein [Bacteroidales bacterium]